MQNLKCIIRKTLKFATKRHIITCNPIKGEKDVGID